MDELLCSARAAVAEGETERVTSLWRQADSPGLDPAERFEWLLLLLEAGNEDEASGAAAALAGTPWQQRAEDVLGSATSEERGGDETGDDDVDVGEEVLRLAAPDTDATVVEQLLRWFGGRRDLYARQWYDERRHRAGYRLVEEPLTSQVARGHLAGRFTVGQYLLHTDGSCSFGVIDLDLSANALAELRATRGDGVRPVEHGPLRDYALRLLDAARRLGLGLFAEDSGGRGVHLWLLLEPRRPARAVRALLAQLVTAAGSQPPDVTAEIFPKQDRLGPKGLSSLVKLPLGIHQATLRRCDLLDESLAPIADPLAALGRLRAAPADLVDDVLGRRVLPMPPLPGPAPLPELPPVPDARGFAEALRAIAPGRPEAAACEAMLLGCAVLRRIVRIAYEQRRLQPVHARAVVYTLGLVGPACALADEIFATAGAPRKELDRARAGLPSPAGCKNLRRLGLATPPECPCREQAEAQPYASPALFAVGACPPGPPRWTRFGPYLEGVTDEAGLLVAELDERLRRIDERLERLEQPPGQEGGG